jgi:hypothetical protein
MNTFSCFRSILHLNCHPLVLNLFLSLHTLHYSFLPYWTAFWMKMTIQKPHSSLFMGKMMGLLSLTSLLFTLKHLHPLIYHFLLTLRVSNEDTLLHVHSKASKGSFVLLNQDIGSKAGVTKNRQALCKLLTLGFSLCELVKS